jgi:hypothetical protein
MANPLKTVVQNTETSFYFKVKDVWTASLELARDFESTENAQLFCAERNLDMTRFQVLRKSPDITPKPERKKPEWDGRSASRSPT